jgi:hypothetical protein
VVAGIKEGRDAARGVDLEAVLQRVQPLVVLHHQTIAYRPVQPQQVQHMEMRILYDRISSPMRAKSGANARPHAKWLTG